MKLGIYDDLTNEQYHASPGVSKSGLWTIYTQTPAHYKFAEREHKPQFDIGTAAHYALLQPELLETKVVEGPPDRRGNRWIDAQNQADAHGLILLTAGDYATAMRLRDAGARNTTLLDVQRGAVVEHSGFAQDPETGTLLRCRPDAYNPRLGLIADLKSAAEAGPIKFGKAASDFGYHMQEAFYTDVWEAASHTPEKVTTFDGRHVCVEAFVFIVIEKKAPFCVACYELRPAAVEEGRQAYKRALRMYAQCEERERLGMPPALAWPGYSSEIQELDIPRWGYRLTQTEDDQ